MQALKKTELKDYNALLDADAETEEFEPDPVTDIIDIDAPVGVDDDETCPTLTDVSAPPRPPKTGGLLIVGLGLTAFLAMIAWASFNLHL